MDHPGRWILALSVVSLMGCSGKKSEPPKIVEPPKKEDPTASRISTGGIEVLGRDEKREAVWKANSAKATIDIAKSGAIRAVMTGVTGNVYKKGLAGATFRADQGQADQKSQDLKLQKNVLLSDPTTKGTLHSEKLQWLPTIKMIQLNGAVTFRGSGLVAGPMDTIWVSPDMKQIGTPNSFKHDANMKNLVAPLLAAVAVASAGTFSDDQGNMRLTFTNWRVTRVDETTSKFNATGNPVSGTWKSQGLIFKARTIDGTLKQQTKGYILTQAELNGNVRTEMNRKEGGITRSSVLTSQKATFSGDAKTGTLSLSGNVVVTSALANSSQWMQLTGTAGDFKLDMTPTTNQSLQSADMSGPVTMRLISKRKSESTDVTATGRHLTFNSGTQELELTGGVIVTGKGPGIMGKMEVDRVRITLDAQGFVKEIYADGEPGKATMGEP